MRRPHRGIQKIPGYRRVGDRLRKALAEVITYHAKEFVAILSVAGNQDRLDIGDATLASARKAMAKEFGTDFVPSQGGYSS